jgi:hypothetical protein
MKYADLDNTDAITVVNDKNDETAKSIKSKNVDIL